MDKLSEVKRFMKQIVAANPNLPITAIVKSVEGDSCTVELISGLILSDVKLKATIGGPTNYLTPTPKVGSTVVLISLSGSLDNLTIIKFDEIEKLAYKQNGLEFIVDSTDGKVSIKNETVSLLEILSDLATTLKELKVFTPVGPSGTPLPPTILAIEDFETKFNQLLK
jgi:hypothetical protein